jgi:hypothetical protein
VNRRNNSQVNEDVAIAELGLRKGRKCRNAIVFKDHHITALDLQ